MDSYTVLLETARPDEVEAIRQALHDAEIPYRSGLLADRPPRVVFSVPSDRVALARAAIVPHVVPRGWIEDSDRVAHTGSLRAGAASTTARPWSAEEALDRLDEVLGDRLGLVATDLLEGPRPPRAEARKTEPVEPGADAADSEPRARFPWRAVGLPAALVLFHVWIVLFTGAFEAGRAMLDHGVLLRGSTLTAPWRLVTSLFLHADLGHALANGLSMLVFAVPLIERLGVRRTAGIYIASGVGGGLTALSLARPGNAFVGSSGAVAGLFGAWVVLAFDRAREADLPWRQQIRALGIALLVLPSLVTPYTPDGRPISVASHVGGLVTGMLIGAVLSGMVGRMQGSDPMFDD